MARTSAYGLARFAGWRDLVGKLPAGRLQLEALYLPTRGRDYFEPDAKVAFAPALEGLADVLEVPVARLEVIPAVDFTARWGIVLVTLLLPEAA